MGETIPRRDLSVSSDECFPDRVETPAEMRAYVLALARQQNVHPLSEEELLKAPFSEDDDGDEFLETFRRWRSEA